MSQLTSRALLTPPRQILTSRLQLRAWTPDDAPALAATIEASEAHLRAWTPWVVDGPAPGLTLAERLTRHAAAFDAGTEWVYGIFLPGSKAVIGGCGLYPRIGPGGLEIGYWLGAANTGRGFATEAAAALAQAAFAEPEIERVELHVDPRNQASAGVPRRLGFRRVGTVEAPPRPPSDTPVVLDVWRLTRADFEARGTVGDRTESGRPR
jgi:RimJ/RimL family protein N-acetyltransferase